MGAHRWTHVCHVIPGWYILSWAFGGFLYWKGVNNWGAAQDREASGRIWIEGKTWIVPLWQRTSISTKVLPLVLSEHLSTLFILSILFGVVGSLVEIFMASGDPVFSYSWH